MTSPPFSSSLPEHPDLSSFRVGIHRTRYLGDILLLVPLLKKLISGGCPRENLFVVVNEGTEFPLRQLGIPFFAFCREDLRHKLLSMRKLGTSFQKRTFELWIDLTVSDRSRFATRQVHSPRKIGAASYKDRRPGDPYDIFVPFDYNHGPGHVSAFWMTLPGRAGLNLPEGPPDFRVPADPSAKEEVRRYLALRSLENRPVLVLHPGGRHWFKRWPPDRFSRLAKWWIQEKGGGVILAGTPDETTLLQSVASGLPSGASALFFQQSVPLLHALLAQAALFVGNDSGPLHLARSAGTPSIALFGSTSPEVWGPFPGERGGVFYHPPVCSPCDHTGCSMGEENCLRQVSVDEVLEAISKIPAPGEFSEGR